MKPILKWIFGGSRVDRLLLAATVVAGANKKAPVRGLGYAAWGILWHPTNQLPGSFVREA